MIARVVFLVLFVHNKVEGCNSKIHRSLLLKIFRFLLYLLFIQFRISNL